MVAGRRFMLAGLAVAAVEAALALVALRTGLAPYLLACALATAGVAIGARGMIAPPRGDDDDTGDDGRGGGGPDGPDDDPPPWWPSFEDAFRAHVRERERDARTTRPPVH